MAKQKPKTAIKTQDGSFLEDQPRDWLSRFHVESLPNVDVISPTEKTIEILSKILVEDRLFPNR